jgi:peptidoglycan/xylan/chitin deacetylase (PgdA/CDA1 family)/lysophospholipase L1-like esterase
MKVAFRCSLVFLLLLALAGSSFAAHGITNWPENKAGAVSLTFDDGTQSQLSLGIPALNARGMKGTFFVITDWVGGAWDPWKNAAIAGHEIGSHTKSHPYLTTLSTSQLIDELGGSLPLIDAQITSQNVFSLAYPYGDVNSTVSSVARDYYSAARGVDCGLNQPPYDFYNVRACSPDSLDDVYYQTDAAEQQGKWLVTFFHSLDGTGYGAWVIGELEDYLDYLKARDLWVGPFDALVKYIREKSYATLSVSSSTVEQIVLSFTDTLDDTIYDVPLTIRSEVPSGWSSVEVQQGSTITTVNSIVEGSTRVIYYSAVPDRGPISLMMSALSGNIAPIVVIDAPAQNMTINKGDSVNFSGNSTDPDGNLPLTHRWRFGAGSGITDSTEKSPGGKKFDNPGIHTVTFAATDALGLETPSPDTRVITVLGDPSDTVVDNGGPGTSFTGGWDISGASGSYGTNSVWSRDGSKYTWSFTPSVTGNYDVSMWWTVWPSRSTSVPVDIRHSGGTARVTINQQGNGGKWNSLGSYSLIAGVSYTVTITSQPGPSSTCADAVKFAYLGGGGGGANQPPVAVNDTASTTQGTPVTIDVVANDTDDVGVVAASVTVVTSPANGAAVPNGSGSVTYTPGGTFTGTDTFRYTVADGQGAVSNAATVTVTVNTVSAEVVVDNGGPGTSFTGGWDISGASGSYGTNSVWSRDGSKYTWSFTPSVTGNYDVSMWWTVWPSRSTSVPVDIRHSGGTARVTINQQGNGGKWNSLGSYSLIAGVSYTVTITSQPGPSSTCADAVKFAYLGGGGGGANQPPVAVNDTASTTQGTPVTIDVVANDTDDVGVVAASVTVVTSPANGAAVPNGSGSVTYTPGGTFTGTDTFRYTVADGQGAVSNAATVTVTVNTVSAEVVVDNGGPGTSFTGGWDISGASGSYGTNSVWSRDGSKYTWSFTPSVTGNYDVSMWWTVWPSRSTSVPVDIRHSGGTARVTINQQGNGGKWNSLGSYSLIAGVSYTVTITSQPGPSSTCADAVKFALLASAQGYVAVGDSITFGSHDDISTDGTGFEPILGNLLTASKGVPVTIANEGVSGATSADGASTISSSLSKYPSAKYYLVMYGTNDAYLPGLPSGRGLIPGYPGYGGSFKDNMQKIVSAILAAGKTPYLAEVPYTSDPLRSNAMIYEYNAAIDELFLTNNILVTPPPFYAYFQTHPGELADGIHPNGTGYQSMADLWFGALTK